MPFPALNDVCLRRRQPELVPTDCTAGIDRQSLKPGAFEKRRLAPP
jgi:hypothetical protein